MRLQRADTEGASLPSISARASLPPALLPPLTDLINIRCDCIRADGFACGALQHGGGGQKRETAASAGDCSPEWSSGGTRKGARATRRAREGYAANAQTSAVVRMAGRMRNKKEEKKKDAVGFADGSTHSQHARFHGNETTHTQKSAEGQGKQLQSTHTHFQTRLIMHSTLLCATLPDR